VNRVKASVSRAAGQPMLPFPPKSAAVLPLKGRGAVTNIQGRYEVDVRERFDDGWSVPGLEADTARALKTEVKDEIAKSILTRNTSPDIPFGVSLNPYRGCEHVM
jgi:hypothetical protein